VSARIVAAGVVLIAAVATPAAAQAQTMVSLADVARQAEAAKVTQVKAKKSYTNADLHGARELPAAGDVPAGYVSASTGKVVTAEEMVKSSEEKVDALNGHNLPEEHWRGRADFIRSQVDKAKSEIARLNIAVPGRSAVLEARNANEIKKYQQMMDGAMKQWALLEESARVARVPADWIGPAPQ
jgi:cysteinyl-tRNA synthetase